MRSSGSSSQAALATVTISGERASTENVVAV
jgi:hypothetical protein